MCHYSGTTNSESTKVFQKRLTLCNCNNLMMCARSMNFSCARQVNLTFKRSSKFQEAKVFQKVSNVNLECIFKVRLTYPTQERENCEKTGQFFRDIQHEAVAQRLSHLWKQSEFNLGFRNKKRKVFHTFTRPTGLIRRDIRLTFAVSASS